MSDGPIEPGTEEGWRVIDTAVRCARSRLGDGLLSAYAIGSLAHGGFCPVVSDVDLALLTDDRRDRDMRQIVAEVIADVGRRALALGDRLSVFYAPWTGFSDPPSDARFPPIDRYDLIHYGTLVHGSDLRAVHGTAPTVDAVREHAIDSALRRVTPALLVDDLHQLVTCGITVHDATKLVLWPVRLQHVCDTGQATGNADAVNHYRQLPDAQHRGLVQDALGWRALPTLPNPHDALERISNEIHHLHAEVLQRLGRQHNMPRHHELAERGRQLTG